MTTETTTKYDDKDIWRHGPALLSGSCRIRTSKQMHDRLLDIQSTGLRCISKARPWLYLYPHGCYIGLFLFIETDVLHEHRGVAICIYKATQLRLTNIFHLLRPHLPRIFRLLMGAAENNGFTRIQSTSICSLIAPFPSSTLQCIVL